MTTIRSYDLPSRAPEIVIETALARNTSIDAGRGIGPPAAVNLDGDEEHLAWHLEFSMRVVPSTRHAVAPYLTQWELAEETADTVSLLVTELVTNALEHGEPPLYLHVFRSRHHVTIVVHDGGDLPCVPDITQAPPHAECGRGLQLIAVLADAFCLARGANGTLAVARLNHR